MRQEKYTREGDKHNRACCRCSKKHLSRLHQPPTPAKRIFYELPRERRDDYCCGNQSKPAPATKLAKRVIPEENNQNPMP